MRIRVREHALYTTDCRARVPFRFGASTLTGASLLTARVVVQSADGSRAEGASADLLVPRWFDKDPAKTVEQDVEALLDSARSAGAAFGASALPRLSPFELWWRVYSAERDQPAQGLVRGFGIALFERAVLDAVCRLAGVSFFEALRDGLFGFEPGRVHPALEGWSLARSLPEVPLARVRVRHTVGLLDPLTGDGGTHGPDDGLPASLEEEIARYGHGAFKLKVGGDPAADAGRLVEVGRLLRSVGIAKPRVTLDGNEQYPDVSTLERLFDRLDADPDGAWLRDAIVFVEQPLPRTESFDQRTTDALARLPVPVILDEADYGIEAFPRAVECGYRGISVKNCKGVFRTLVNRGLCDVLGEGLFQSAEDLTNLPVLALHQDLATVAALGFAQVERNGVERNGHHYFAGLRHLPEPEAEEALARHPDLYERREEGIVLRIEDGHLDVRSLQCRGYGYDVSTRFEDRAPVALKGPSAGQGERTKGSGERAR